MSPDHRRWRLLVALGGGVLVVHLLALQALPARLGSDASPGTARIAAPLWIRALDTALDPSPRPAPLHSLAPSLPPMPAARPPGLPADARDPATTTAVSSSPPGESAAGPAHGRAATPQGNAQVVPARVAPALALVYTLAGQSHGLPVAGRAELHWQHDGQRYEARLETQGEGMARRSLRSAGEITPGGLRPERFSERTRSEEAVHFLHATGRIVFSANRPEAVLIAGAQDRLSVLLQVGALIAARPQAYPVGASLAVQTATARDAEIWRFRIEGIEELRGPGGPPTLVHLVRPPTREFEPKMELWLAPTLDYVPVRVRLTQASGDWLEYQRSDADKR